MRLSLRFIVPLLLALAAVAYAVVPLVDRFTQRWFVRDLETRSALLANSVDEQLGTLLRDGNASRVSQFFTRLTQDERLFALAYCASTTADAVGTPTLPREVQCGTVRQLVATDGGRLVTPTGDLHVTAVPTPTEAAPAGVLVVVHDMSFIGRRGAETRKYLFYLFVGLGFVVSVITVVIAQLSWRGWVHGLRALARGEWQLLPLVEKAPAELRPVARDLRALIRDIEAAHRPREASEVQWSPEALRTVLQHDLRGQDVIVVSNRQPFIHERDGDRTFVRRPASGLVTALEPIMRACSGTWIAHGNGTADREVVDKHDRIGVPPERPAYRLRRIWMTADEERGYYYGFANEGLWPLCHIAHVRPVFRSSDWNHYVTINQRFAQAVVRESPSPDPVVLVQDYHLALLPRMIRAALPSATVITFWHIPWPNPEAFAICPWREELLDGLLGSSILGFHTQFHCNNFLDTVDRLLEARVDRDTLNVSFRGELTAVHRYPISIEWPPPPALTARSVEDCRAALRSAHGLPEGHAVTVGVDRLDYTKGIEERFRAVARLLEIRPEWIGRFTLVQVAAPSRSGIEQYSAYEERVRALAARINERFPDAAHPPIVLVVKHLEAPAVHEHYRGADVCFVTSLHDGMNLVAKEFVASRDDERGVLILSRFTGAARELPEALVVNPYDADECASALQLALTMPPAEQRDRLRVMRGLLREFSVYRWAGRMLIDAAAMRRRERLRDRLADARTT